MLTNALLGHCASPIVILVERESTMPIVPKGMRIS
jgi:hypothetical protein